MINQAFTTKIVVLILVSIFLTSLLIVPSSSSAQSPTERAEERALIDSAINRGIYSDQFTRPGFAPSYDGRDADTNNDGTVDPTEAAAVATERNRPEIPPTVDFANPIYQFLFEFVLNVFGTLFAFAGALMSFGINEFMLGFGDKYLNWNIGVAVEETWRIVRDLFNLTFIFGLVYIGFKMILDSSDSRARSMLVSLIGAALLVNFSLFITKFIIDLSHVAAQVVADGFGSAKDNIANAFINILDLETTLLVTQGQINAFSDGGALAYIFGLMIFLAVATFVFAAGGILLIIRFIALNVYMVFSPVMFLGWVFPAFSGTSSKYWKGFLRQAFFAPAYLLMLYLSFKVLYAYRLRPGENSYSAMFSEDAAARQSALEILPFFIMAMVFLVMSLVVARNMGSVGASTAISIGNNLQRNVRGNMTSFAGRNSVGRVSSYMAKNQDTKGGRVFGGIVTAASLGTINNRTQRNLYEAGKKSKFGGSYSRADDKDYSEKVTGLVSTEKTKVSNKEAIAQGQTAMLIPAADRTPEQERSIQKMQSVIAGMGVAQLEALSDKERTAIAGEFTSTQTEALMKSDKLSNDDKAAISKKRQEVIKNVILSGSNVMSEALSELSTNQIETLGDEFILANAADFSEDQFKEITKSKKFTEGQVARYKSTRKSVTKSRIASGDPDEIDKVFNRTKAIQSGNGVMIKSNVKKAKEIAALEGSALTSDSAIPYITMDVIKEIISQKTLTDDERRDLKNKVLDPTKGNKHRKKLEAYFRTPKGIEEFGA
jgi:hypothetical protein